MLRALKGFQKDEIVWKDGDSADNVDFDFRVSEGLNSVESLGVQWVSMGGSESFRRTK